MRGLIWLISVAVFAVWSFVAWGAWALVGTAGRVASQNADVVPGSPELVEWISWLAGTGADVGAWLVIAVWALGSIAIFALTGLANTIVARRQLPDTRS
jgi:hypothetical protein